MPKELKLCQDADIRDASSGRTILLAYCIGAATRMYRRIRLYGYATAMKMAVHAIRRKWLRLREGVAPVAPMALHGDGTALIAIGPTASPHPAPIINAPATACNSQSTDHAIDLQPGELVEVKSQDEILSTLDQRSKTNGLGFMPGMLEHCGKRYIVFKRVDNIILEGTGEMRHMRSTILLEGVICKGEGWGCDRSCFYFWRECWLRRVTEERQAGSHGSAGSRSCD